MVGLLMCNLYFYPRSPCGERLQWEGMRSLSEVISIHALLAESDKDTLTDDVSTGGFLSTLSLRRATRAFLARPFLLQFLSTLSLRRATVYPGTWSGSILISIHALLAESDGAISQLQCALGNFYPRSPCGERLRLPTALRTPHQRFLSTLSLRRATRGGHIIKTRAKNFYPRSPCGERRAYLQYLCELSLQNFYPRSPCGERRLFLLPFYTRQQFLSTLSLRRATRAAARRPV